MVLSLSQLTALKNRAESARNTPGALGDVRWPEYAEELADSAQGDYLLAIE